MMIEASRTTADSEDTTFPALSICVFFETISLSTLRRRLKHDDEPTIELCRKTILSSLCLSAHDYSAGAERLKGKWRADSRGAPGCDQISGGYTAKGSRFAERPFRRPMEIQVGARSMVRG